MQGVKSLEGNHQSREPLACLGKVRAIHCQPCINPLFQMGLKCREDPMSIASTHFVGADFPGDCGYEFQFHQRANRPFMRLGQRTLCLPAQWFGAVIGGQHTGVNVNQYRLLLRPSVRSSLNARPRSFTEARRLLKSGRGALVRSGRTSLPTSTPRRNTMISSPL